MKFKNIFLPWLLPLFLLTAWQIGSATGLFPETILPSPAVIAQTLWEAIIGGEVVSNLAVTLERTVIGLSIGVSSGFLLGILTATVPLFDALLSPSIIAFRQIPMFAWIPMIILVFGIEEGSKIVFIAIGTFYPIIINTYDGIKSVPNKYLEVARVYEYTPVQTFQKVIFPAAFPSIITGLRFSIGMSWMLVVGAEILGSATGIGFLMAWSRQMFQLDRVFAYVIVVGGIGIIINALITGAEKKLLSWRGGGNGSGI
jgi:sulfonate transport system permease protein